MGNIGNRSFGGKISTELTDRCRKFLHEGGYLVTKQRKRIAEIIFTTFGQFRVEDIKNLLHQKIISASNTSM